MTFQKIENLQILLKIGNNQNDKIVRLNLKNRFLKKTQFTT